MTDCGEELELALYHQLGLRPSTAGLADPNPPRGTSLRLALHGTEARIELTQRGARPMNSLVASAGPPASPGSVLHAFQLTDDATLRLWGHTLAHTGQCLLLTGRALGLDHPSLERIDILLDEGEALAAVIAATIRHD